MTVYLTIAPTEKKVAALLGASTSLTRPDEP
jgi:hypothetical protein